MRLKPNIKTWLRSNKKQLLQWRTLKTDREKLLKEPKRRMNKMMMSLMMMKKKPGPRKSHLIEVTMRREMKFKNPKRSRQKALLRYQKKWLLERQYRLLKINKISWNNRKSKSKKLFLSQSKPERNKLKMNLSHRQHQMLKHSQEISRILSSSTQSSTNLLKLRDKRNLLRRKLQMSGREPWRMREKINNKG